MTALACVTDTRIIVFARASEPGVAKTRLIPLLGAERAAALQRILIDHALSTALAAGIGPVELWCAPSAQHPQLAQCAERHGVGAASQCDGDLGARMLHAAVTALAVTPHVIIIGADCPALTAADLQRVAAALADRFDAVLIPAEDGGYVLIGLRCCDARLFTDIAWGGNQVMAATRERLAALDWRWCELPASWDVDRPADFERLAASGLIPNLEQFLD
ncbi:MAG: TIGR04282 family arsenosugar biosynthesis glycosyltransferase [Betaproteobacteria bacterium]|nr:TIGR04282 family arsenosugar biosynthesis glycosyltransferase [Betaproteobacteria bacterium]